MTTRVRFALTDDGRLEPVELHVEGTVRLTGDVLRLVPLSQLEGWANGRGRDEIIESLNEIDDDTEQETRRWRSAVGGDTVYLGPARSVRRRALRLRVPPGPGKKPDKFYERVAELYMALVSDPDRARSRRPAQEIYEANKDQGIKVTTVHRWIREARNRTLLTTAERGRAG
jgi:hypothetical protein